MDTRGGGGGPTRREITAGKFGAKKAVVFALWSFLFLSISKARCSKTVVLYSVRSRGDTALYIDLNRFAGGSQSINIYVVMTREIGAKLSVSRFLFLNF